jgi:hypothetical protein
VDVEMSLGMSILVCSRNKMETKVSGSESHGGEGERKEFKERMYGHIFFLFQIVIRCHQRVKKDVYDLTSLSQHQK